MSVENPVTSGMAIQLVATSPPPRGLFRFLPPATRAELWGGIAFLTLALLGAAWVLKCRSDALALERDNVTVSGKVLRLWVSTGKGSHKHVAYQYPAPSDAETRTFHDDSQISDEAFARLKEGGPIAVKVCRTDPTIHQIAGGSGPAMASTAAMYLCLGVLAFLALMGVINLGWWWKCRRNPPPAQFVVVSMQSASCQVIDRASS
jgi:hypothetical protein